MARVVPHKDLVVLEEVGLVLFLGLRMMEPQELVLVEVGNGLPLMQEQVAPVLLSFAR